MGDKGQGDRHAVQIGSKDVAVLCQICVPSGVPSEEDKPLEETQAKTGGRRHTVGDITGRKQVID